MIAPEFKGFLRSVVETLERLGLLYAIGGSVASSIYGEARSTLDVDISVMLPLEQIMPFAEAFQALGYYAYPEAILDAVIAHQPFNIIDSRRGFKADIFPVDPDLPTHQERQVFLRSQRRVYDRTDNATAEVYSPEDVIVYKLKYYTLGRIPKHLRDIGAILAVQGDALDYDYIASWATQIGASEIWDALVAARRGSQP
jgi:hypothetical protein